MEFNAADANFINYAFFSAATKCSSPSSMQRFAIGYAAEARSFYARSSSFKTQTVFASVSDTSIQCNAMICES